MFIVTFSLSLSVSLSLSLSLSLSPCLIHLANLAPLPLPQLPD